MPDEKTNFSHVDRYIAFRDASENPKSPACALHLRRICGTCAHFAGHLRQGPGLASCRLWEFEVHRLANPRWCPRWTRRTS